MERIEEFTINGRNFIYIDLSDLKASSDFLEFAEPISATIAKYPEQSVYAITNIENMRFDSESKDIITEYMKQNNPYVKYGVLIGIDGIKKIMALEVFKIIGRTNMGFSFSKEHAIEWLLLQED